LIKMRSLRSAPFAIKNWTVILSVAGVLGACGSTPEPYATADAVAAGMNDAGVDCEGFATTEAPQEVPREHESLVEEQGVCAVGGETITIRTFEDEEARDDWVAVGGKVVGSLAVGPNWVVAGRSEALIEDIAEALDAVPPDEASSL
jgi:hypothetical protein